MVQQGLAQPRELTELPPGTGGTRADRPKWAQVPRLRALSLFPLSEPSERPPRGLIGPLPPTPPSQSSWAGGL